MVEFGNKPMILHQIEALAAAGVTDVVLAVNYRPEIMEKHLAEVSLCHPPVPRDPLLTHLRASGVQIATKFGINITFSIESEPLGTAGP